MSDRSKINWDNYGKNTIISVVFVVVIITIFSIVFDPVGWVYVLYLVGCFGLGWFSQTFMTEKDVWGFLTRLRSSD